MKRSNEKLRSQLSASLLQLEEARLSMEQCDINGLIVNTYREATRGLKAARMAGDLTMETVDDAMVMLQEEMDEMNSIGEIIGGRSRDSSDFTYEQRTELELELRTLMEDEVPPCLNEEDSSALVDALSRLDFNESSPIAQATPQQGCNSELNPSKQLVPI